ncbi:MAG: translation initiation factor 2 [Myxococcales bacterium]
MRTLTEFSGTLIRMAASAASQARKSLPKEAFTLRVPAPPVEEVETAHPHDNASQAAPDTGVDSATDAADERLAADAVSHIPASAEPPPEPFKPGEAGTAERGSTEDPDVQARKEEAVAGKDLAGQAQDGAPAEPIEDPPRTKPQKGPQGPVEEAETEAAKAALDEAVSKATGTTGDRLERLREALKAVGGRADRVRLVRVFSAEEPVQGATKIGEHYYIVDLMPQSMKQEFKTDDRAGGGGARRGPRRPSGGGSKGKEGTLEGSFSMESVMQDRKNERPSGGGRRPGAGGAGGGRGRPGGGRGPGGPGGGGRGPGGGGGRPGGGRSGPPKGP